jgi:hypothetical protein
MVFFHPPVIPIAIAIMGMAAEIDVGARNTNYHFSLCRRECDNAYCAKMRRTRPKTLSSTKSF